MKKKILFSIMLSIVVSALTLFQGAVGYAGEVKGVSEDTIKIGFILDLTGPTAGTWRPIYEGVRNYWRFVNDQGGIHGRKITILPEDDRYTIPMAVAAFKKLVHKDEVLAFQALGSTGSHIALFSKVAKEKTPVITPVITETIATPTKRYFFLTSSTYQDAIGVIMDYIMREMKAKNPKIAYVSSDTEWGKTGLRAVIKNAERYKLRPVHTEILGIGALDATTQALSLNRAKVDFIVIQHIVETAALLLREMKRYKIDIPVFGTVYTASEEMIEMAGEGARNFYAVHPCSSWNEDNPGMAQLREISLKYQPEKKFQSRIYASGWIAALIFAEGIKRAGRNLTNESLVDALETIKDLETGISGPVTFGPDKHKSTDYCKLFKTDLNKKLLVPVGGWRRPGQ
ncbi:MAG: ABC transporter substrate-binding protein [Pseudomonadota bacterium]